MTVLLPAVCDEHHPSSAVWFLQQAVGSWCEHAPVATRESEGKTKRTAPYQKLIFLSKLIVSQIPLNHPSFAAAVLPTVSNSNVNIANIISMLQQSWLLISSFPTCLWYYIPMLCVVSQSVCSTYTTPFSSMIKHDTAYLQLFAHDNQFQQSCKTPGIPTLTCSSNMHSHYQNMNDWHCDSKLKLRHGKTEALPSAVFLLIVHCIQLSLLGPLQVLIYIQPKIKTFNISSGNWNRPTLNHICQVCYFELTRIGFISRPWTETPPPPPPPPHLYFRPHPKKIPSHFSH